MDIVGIIRSERWKNAWEPDKEVLGKMIKKGRTFSQHKVRG